MLLRSSHVLPRSAVVVVLSLIILLAGLGTPGARAADVPAETRIQRLEGLAAAPSGDGGGLKLQTAAEHVLSEPTATPMPFSMVGFALPEGATADFRTSPDGSEWSEWEHAWVNPDEGPDPDAAEAQRSADAAPGQRLWTEPVWVGEASWIQLRVAGASPQDVVVELIDSAGLSRSWLGQARDAVAAAWRGTPQPAAQALASQPNVVRRAEWGADESLRRGEPLYSRRIRFGVVHHTATTNDYTRAQAPAVVRGIYAYHVRSNGWADIGYNLLVDRFGTVYEGRHGGLERNVMGAHAGGFNSNSFGVSFIGTHSNGRPTEDAFEAMAEVFAWKFDLAHVDVAAAYTATSRGSTRYRSGARVTVATMSGHRDLSATTCPGEVAYDLLPRLRHRVLELQGDALLDHAASPGTLTVVRGQSLDGPVVLSTRLRPAGEWELEVRDPSGDVVHRDGGEGAEAVSRWEPSGAATGTYTYTFSAAGRRSASDAIELVAPVITGASATPTSTRHRDGTLVAPVTVTARAYPGAEWTVTFSDRDGQPVAVATGTGQDVHATWSGPVPAAGTYRWTVEAVGAEPATGTVEVVADVVDRTGTASGPTLGSVELSREAFPEPLSARHAVIARADVFADALSGGPLAATRGPVLLNPSDELHPDVLDELRRVLPAGDTVYVLGGESALSEDVESDLEAVWDVRRLSGRERTETAAAVAEVVFERAPDDATRTAMVARSGTSGSAPWADALAGGAYGAAEGIPVLLTDTQSLSEPTAEVLDDHDVESTIVLGGTAAVSEGVAEDLPSPRRISGGDRAATAVQIARQLWGRTAGGSGDRFVLSEGYREDAWTLALAASPLAAQTSAPLLLTEPRALASATASYLDDLGYGDARTGKAFVLGDEASVSASAADAVSRLLQ